ncbi:MAG: hypothetical protein R3321_14440, partial [Nitrososphaeraceae archaeon]|nr:hypothetical protein [Nitrososphaeraceae archaeon]
TINKEIVYDYPKEAKNAKVQWCIWYKDFNMSSIIREYLDTPVKELFSKKFEKDLFGLTEILKVCDRRLSKGKRQMLCAYSNREAMKKVLKAIS